MADNQQVKKGNFLDHLTKGLYDAVVQAQALAENQHIESLRKFVNEDGKEIFVQLTPKKLAEWKEKKIGYYAESKRNKERDENGKFKGRTGKLSRREQRDLNKLRRHRE